MSQLHIMVIMSQLHIKVLFKRFNFINGKTAHKLQLYNLADNDHNISHTINLYAKEHSHFVKQKKSRYQH